MSYLVLARKYRPRNFAEMVGQDHVVQALSNALGTQRLHHAYLFTGTRGVGKTTVTLAQLESEFAGIAALPEAEQPVVRIRADSTLPYQKVIDVMSTAKSKGLVKVGLDTEIR